VGIGRLLGFIGGIYNFILIGKRVFIFLQLMVFLGLCGGFSYYSGNAF